MNDTKLPFDRCYFVHPQEDPGTTRFVPDVCGVLRDKHDIGRRTPHKFVPRTVQSKDVSHVSEQREVTSRAPGYPISPPVDADTSRLSDEEIEEERRHVFGTDSMLDDAYGRGSCYGFRIGARWMRDRIQQAKDSVCPCTLANCGHCGRG